MLGALDDEDKRILGLAPLGVDLTEVYSPQRVTHPRHKFKLITGSAMDLQNGWDFTRGDHRSLAVEKLKEEKTFSAD